MEEKTNRYGYYFFPFLKQYFILKFASISLFYEQSLSGPKYYN